MAQYDLGNADLQGAVQATGPQNQQFRPFDLRMAPYFLSAIYNQGGNPNYANFGGQSINVTQPDMNFSDPAYQGLGDLGALDQQLTQQAGSDLSLGPNFTSPPDLSGAGVLDKGRLTDYSNAVASKGGYANNVPGSAFQGAPLRQGQTQMGSFEQGGPGQQKPVSFADLGKANGNQQFQGMGMMQGLGAGADGTTAANYSSPIAGSPGVSGSGFSQDQVNTINQGFAANSGFNYAKLAQDHEEFLADLQLKRDQMEQMGIPEVAIRAELALAEVRHNDQTYKLALGNLALEQQKFAESQRQFNATNSLDQGKLGLASLSEAAKLGGPSDYYQYANFLSGAQQMPGLPNWLASLSGNTGQQLPSFGGQAMGTPQTAQSMGTLAAGMAGGTPGGAPGGPYGGFQAGAQGMPGNQPGTTQPAPTGGAATGNGLSNFAQLGQAGGQSMAPGSWESLSPSQQGIAQSGLKATGNDPKDFLNQYQNSLPGQKAGTSNDSF